MSKNLGDLGEFGLIERIKKEFASQTKDLITGIGDDAAVFSTPTRISKQLVTTDMLVERVHFDLSYTSPELLGRKSLSVNLSDIAGMGGTPRFATLALAIDQRKTTLGFMEAFLKGFKEVAKEYKVALIGGDMSSSKSGLVISVTVLGLAEKPVLRSGAKPGDFIYVTGTLGDSSTGMKILKKGLRLKNKIQEKHFIVRHLDPTPRINTGQSIAKHVSAMIDLSDGLLGDLQHICKESNVAAWVDTELLPLSDASGLSLKDARLHALTGGEDYELLFTAQASSEKKILAAGKKCNIPITKIGQIVKGKPEVKVENFTGSDQLKKMKQKGYKHF